MPNRLVKTINAHDGDQARDLNRGDFQGRLSRARQDLRMTRLESTQALVAAVEARDPYIRAHSRTVATYAGEMGRRLGLSRTSLESLRAAALLHDVGKIGMPDFILTKPGPLTPDEFEIVKRHPVTALEILQGVSFLADVRPMILYHHERFDGQGYPHGLSGDAIPVGARILAIADAVDTMLSPRPYKAAYALDRVRSELRAGGGSQFDPDMTAMTLRLLDDTPELFRPQST